MRDNPYKDLPPLESRPDGSLYCMTPAQRKQAAENRKRTEKEVCCGQLGAKKALIYQASQALNRGRWYKVSPAPENGLLTVHKTRYDKHDLHSSAGKGVQLHPAPEFSL